jgi:hypothetical protein
MTTAGKDSRGAQIEITGLKRTVRQLKELDVEAPKAVKALHREAAALVAATARERAPVGHQAYDPHPGALRATIRPGATQYMAVVRAGGAKVPYAPPIHWGWGKRHIRPQPFMYEALDARRAEVEAAYDRGIKALVENTVTGSGAD